MDFRTPSSPYELVPLRSGGFSLRSLEYGEVLHPGIGPLQEGDAVYVIPLRLRERLHEGTEPWVVWDVGLGGGANALAVLRAVAAAKPARPVQLLSFDRTLDPLRAAWQHRAALGYLTGYEWSVRSLLTDGLAQLQVGASSLSWSVHLGDFPTQLASAEAALWPSPHAILYDPFSLARNPSMWTLPLFRSLFLRLDAGRPCGLATYSRSTLLRVTLLVAGFYVGAGPSTGRKEETTIAANALGLLERPLDRSWLRRADASESAEPLLGPRYVQAPLTPATRMQLHQHPQFA